MSGESGAGTFLQVLGNLVTGGANAAASEYNASIARMNATIAGQQSVAAVQAIDRDARRAMGKALAAYGASGIDAGSSSMAMEVLAESARMGEFNKLTTKYNYELKALGYNNQAKLFDMSAEASQTAAMLNTSATIANSNMKFDFGSNSGSERYPSVDASSNQG